MNNLEDQVMSPIIMGIAIDLGMDVARVQQCIESYYGEVANLMTKDKPYEIKMDYFGKIRAKKQYVAYREAQKQQFDELNMVDYGTVSVES